MKYLTITISNLTFEDVSLDPWFGMSSDKNLFLLSPPKLLP